MIAFSVVAAIAIGWLFPRSITVPINKLRNVAEQLGEGNLDVRANVESGDEIGSLATSFDQMATALQQAEEQRGGLIGELEEQKEQLEVRVQGRTLAFAKAREEFVDSRRRVMTVSEGMRRDIAQQLHGTVQNKLIVVQHLLGQLAGKSEVESTRDELSKLDEIIKDLIQNDVRNIGQQLYPAVLGRGLIPALISLFSGMGPALRVESQLSEDLQRRETAKSDFISLTCRLAAYRIAEDALTNVIKHSETNAATVHLELRKSGSS